MFQLQLFFCQIWYRHPNSEAGNDEIQNVQREDFNLWVLHSKILVGYPVQLHVIPYN
jgi:hypothetical protein